MAGSMSSDLELEEKLLRVCLTVVNLKDGLSACGISTGQQPLNQRPKVGKYPSF
jgi:hypothetical protein